MKLRRIISGLLVLQTLTAQGQVQSTDPLDSVLNLFETETEISISEFREYSQQAREEYEQFEIQARAEYEQYVESVKRVWGGDSIIENTRTEWVEYNSDYTSRSIVDFDEGNISIEVALDENETADDARINDRLTQAIEQLLTSQGTTHPYDGTLDTTNAVSEIPILDGIVDLSAYRLTDSENSTSKRSARPTPPAPTVRGQKLNLPTQLHKGKTESGQTMAAARLQDKEASSIGKQHEDARQQARQKAEKKYKINVKVDGESTQINVTDAAKAIANQSVRTTTKVKGSNGEERTVVKVEMAMTTDYLNEKAAQYKNLVSEFSQKFQIEEPLIYAVMEQESRFNPQATSHIPAYGLMQLVPASGGCDAYTYVKKLSEPQRPQPSYLYVPRNNVELGTAYLRILMNRFALVTDPDCRRLCVIAAYNTGEGNVSHSFVGKRASAKSIASHINALNYTQLYNHLTTHLSTSEARNYVSGVSRRREKYMK